MIPFKFPLQMRESFVRVIALLADVHSGTQYSLAPESFTLKEGNEIGINSGQRMILEHWEYFWEKADQAGVDTVVFNGDSIHGQNPNERGITLWSTDLDEQITAHIMLVKPHLIGKKIHYISGSGYHKSIRGGNPEKYICDQLNADPDIRAEWQGPLAIGCFEPSELRWFISHGESAAYIYQSMLQDRENLHLNAAIGLGNMPMIHIVAHAHWHTCSQLWINKQTHLQIPGWCAFVPWKGSMILYPKFSGPAIGGMIVKLTSDNKAIIDPILLDKIPKIADYERPL